MQEADAETAVPETAPGFLELESMASMHRIGDDAPARIGTGSTLADLDGLATRQAEQAARDHREGMQRGRHDSERYRVVSEIARGGMGAVLEVHDSDLDRRVAMKVLLRDTRRDESDTGTPLDPGPVSRFIGEAQLTGNLEHPNIVPVHELGLDSQGRIYFTMKRVKGRSLRHVMDKLRQGHEATLAEFPTGKLLTILLKVCDAIDFAHSRGIIHRDLKPENIMVGQFGEVLVMDWGLAKQVEGDEPAAVLPVQNTRFRLDVALGAADGEGSEQTREGTVSGTPAYMSPEQARGKVNELSRLTDVYCVGAMLYEMLCMVPPFLAADMHDALELAHGQKLLQPRQKLEQVLRDPQLKRAFGPAGIERGRRYPPELASIAAKAMAEQPLMRYGSIAEFRRDVERYLSAQPVRAHRDRPWTAVSKWTRRNPTRAAVLALALFFVLLAGAAFSFARASIAADRAELAEEARLAVESQREEVERRLTAEAEARQQAERARAQAEEVARLREENLERERREADALAARAEAFVPFSGGADLRARAASFTDWREKAPVWREAARQFRAALERDPTFVEAHLELANVYADLGYDDDALRHYARADALTASRTGRGHVEALMAYAMYDFQRKVLRDGLSGGLDEVFQRFRPVRDAADADSNYARIAQILIDLGEAYRNAQGAEFMRARDNAADRLAEIEREAVPLWEVYSLLALFGPDPLRDGSDHLRRAFELKPNLPLLVRLEVLQGNRNSSVSEARAISAWSRFIENFPYDPRGYYSRAAQRFQSETSHDYTAEVADLRQALTLNPRYADAHKLLLHVHVREGSDDAIAHIEAMRRSPTGLDNAAINLIEAELTASIGRFDRMATLVMSSMQENSVEGTEVLAHAAAVLLRDHEYQEVEELCDIVQQRMQATTPAIVPILQGRALTMLGRFEEASRLFEPLERDPALLARQLRSTLAGWADDAREYPVMLSTLNSVPGPRQRFDLARILAISGADPAIWVPLFNTDGLNPNESVNWVYPGDHVLNAIGHAMLAQRMEGINARGLRTRAVQLLRQAFEEGFLNRARIRRDPSLQTLLGEAELQPYFKVE